MPTGKENDGRLTRDKNNYAHTFEVTYDTGCDCNEGFLQRPSVEIGGAVLVSAGASIGGGHGGAARPRVAVVAIAAVHGARFVVAFVWTICIYFRDPATTTDLSVGSRPSQATRKTLRFGVLPSISLGLPVLFLHAVGDALAGGHREGARIQDFLVFPPGLFPFFRSSRR